MELLIKIGDSGGSKDGQIIAVKPNGWLIAGSDMRTWIDDGVEPVVLLVMPQYQSDQLKRRINRLRWELTHTAAEIATEFDSDEQSAANDKAMAVTDRARMIAEGVDTNWGFEDLKTHFALSIDSDDPHDYIELVDREQGTDHKARITAKRRNKVEYDKVYDAAKLAEILDKDRRVDVDRDAKLTRTIVEPITRAR
ncbi:MAG: hypothetical protein HQ526_03840 [Actinobacteria bacterium]|nr:hypothetical protein [Actinomycetota bacterium]